MIKLDINDQQNIINPVRVYDAMLWSKSERMLKPTPFVVSTEGLTETVIVIKEQLKQKKLPAGPKSATYRHNAVMMKERLGVPFPSFSS